MAVWAMRRVMSLAPFTLTGRHEPFCCLHTHAPSRPYSLQCTIMPCTNKLPSRTQAGVKQHRSRQQSFRPA